MENWAFQRFRTIQEKHVTIFWNKNGPKSIDWGAFRRKRHMPSHDKFFLRLLIGASFLSHDKVSKRIFTEINSAWEWAAIWNFITCKTLIPKLFEPKFHTFVFWTGWTFRCFVPNQGHVLTMDYGNIFFNLVFLSFLRKSPIWNGHIICRICHHTLDWLGLYDAYPKKAN